MALKITILGCGSSGGVPRIGGQWGACDPENSKNRRQRCSIFVEKFNPDTPDDTTKILVDTSPDLRNQFLANNFNHLDGVCLTHTHADHINGMDDLRVVYFNMRRKTINLYLSEFSLNRVKERFGYVMTTPDYDNYPPFINSHIIDEYESFAIKGEGGSQKILPITQDHGMISSFAFRFDDVVYANDLISIPEASKEHYYGLEVLILDALQYDTHPTHLNVEQALALIDEFKPKRAYLTNLHIALDYDILMSELPKIVEPAYDGLTITTK